MAQENNERARGSVLSCNLLQKVHAGVNLDFQKLTSPLALHQTGNRIALPKQQLLTWHVLRLQEGTWTVGTKGSSENNTKPRQEWSSLTLFL